jgi:hypothetical protein
MERRKYERRDKNSHINSELHMIYVSSNNGRYPVTNTFTPLHCASPNYTSFHKLLINEKT